MTAGDHCGYIFLVSHFLFLAWQQQQQQENILSTENPQTNLEGCDKAPHPVAETSGSLNLRHCSAARLALRTSSAESSAPMVARVLRVINNIMFCNYLLCVPHGPREQSCS